MGESLAVSWPASSASFMVLTLPSISLARSRTLSARFSPPSFEHGGDLLQHGDQLVEDGGCGPLHQALGVDGEEIVDRERNPASDERVHKALGREDVLGGLQHYNEDRGDGSLVDQYGSSSEENGGRHRKEYDDGDLERPVPYDEHEEVGHHKPDGDPEDELDGAPVPLAERYAEADDGGYGGEEGLLVPDEHLSHEVGQARGHSRLQDGPHAGPETVVPRRESVTDPGKQTPFSHGADRTNPLRRLYTLTGACYGAGPSKASSPASAKTCSPRRSEISSHTAVPLTLLP